MGFLNVLRHLVVAENETEQVTIDPNIFYCVNSHFF